MKSYQRACGNLSAFAFLVLLPLLVVVAGCGSSSDSYRTHHRAYVANYDDSSISVIDTDDNSVVKTIHLPHNAGYTAVLPSLNRLFVTGLNSRYLTVISTHTNTIIETIQLPGWAGGIAADPATNTVFVAEHGTLVSQGHVWVVDGWLHRDPVEITVGDVDLQFIAVDSRNRRAYVTDAGDGTDPGVVYPINADNRTVYAAIPCGVSPSGVSVLPDDHLVYVTNFDDNSVTVIDTSENVPATSTITENIGAGPYSVSIDTSLGRAVVTNSTDSTASVIDTATSTVIAPTSGVSTGTSPVWSDVDMGLHRAYVVNSGTGDVTVVDLQSAPVRVLATIQVGGMPISVSVIE